MSSHNYHDYDYSDSLGMSDDDWREIRSKIRKADERREHRMEKLGLLWPLLWTGMLCGAMWVFFGMMQRAVRGTLLP